MSMPVPPSQGDEGDPPPWLIRHRRSTRARILWFALLGGGAVSLLLGTIVGWVLWSTEPPNPWDHLPVGLRVRVADDRPLIRYSAIATLFLAPAMFLVFAIAASVHAGLKGMARSSRRASRNLLRSLGRRRRRRLDRLARELSPEHDADEDPESDRLSSR
jgi:hypothetical protein